ncbi:MAG: hypothetical protein KKD17_05420 [Nanoarchaeota archaeon]|nr:hypothetical protein [Nanoarchaeota archaeon]
MLSGSDFKQQGKEAQQRSIEDRIAGIVSGMNRIARLPAGDAESVKLLQYLGEESLNPAVVELLRKGRGYSPIVVRNPDFRDAKTRVLVRSGESVELLVENSYLESVGVSPSDKEPLHYLNYLKVAGYDLDKYVNHIRHLTVGQKRSLRFFIKNYLLPVAFAGGAVAGVATGNWELGGISAGTGLLYFMGQQGWDTFQKVCAYDNMLSFADGEERKTGLSALSRAFNAGKPMFH